MEKDRLGPGEKPSDLELGFSGEISQILSKEHFVEKLEQGRLSFEDVKNLSISDRVILVRFIADEKGWEIQQVIEDTILGRGDKYLNVLEVFAPDLLQQFYKYITKIIEDILDKEVGSLNYTKDEVILFYENFLRRFEITSISVPMWIKQLNALLLVLRLLEEEDILRYKIQLRKIWEEIKNGNKQMNSLKEFLETYSFPARISFWKLSHVLDNLSYEEQIGLVRVLIEAVERFVLYGEGNSTNKGGSLVIGIDFGQPEEIIKVPLSVNEKFLIISYMNSVIFEVIRNNSLGKVLNQEFVERYANIITKVVRDVDKLDPLFSFQGVFDAIKTSINFFSPRSVEKVIEKFCLRLQVAGVYVVDFYELKAFYELLEFLKINRIFGRSKILPLSLLDRLRNLLMDMEFFIGTLMGDDIKSQYSEARSVLINILNLLSFDENNG